MSTTYIPSYIIKSNSKLIGYLPIYKVGTITNITNICKIGTTNKDNISTNGAVSFNILNETALNNNVITFIEFTYKASKLYVGDDSFEFTINYEDGTKVIKQIKISIRQNDYVETNNINYIEVFCKKDESFKNIELQLEPLFYTTRGMLTLSNQDFLVDKNGLNINRNNEETIIVGNISNAKATVIASTSSIKTPLGDVTFINSLSLRFDKSTEGFKTNEYFKVNLYSSINKDGESVDNKFIYNFIFHQTNIGENHYYIDDINVEPFLGYREPTLVVNDVEFPDAPIISTDESNLLYVTGDLLSNTRAHKEKDNNGNKTVRLGNTVPQDAVNLGYYYNATSSLKDTVSVIETNTNTVTMHYVEKWVHKYALPSESEDFFLDSIEFDGEPGTNLEGFWGILHRDYVLWEIEPLIDQNPQYITIYERYYGLSSKDVPLIKPYQSGTKSGNLELSHSIYTEIDFKKSEIPNLEFEARRWQCLAKYNGMIKDTVYQYNGSARYSGVVTKKDGMSNLEPEQEKELVMFPNSTGMLYLPNGNNLIDDDLFYITDKFKDDTPLYYKHKLKFKIYDSVGADNYGIYNTENIKLVSENNAPINESKYKYKVYIKPTEYKNIYDAFIYTSFIPTLEIPIYVMYNGIQEESYVTNNVNPLNINIGILEKLSVIPAFDTDEYIVDIKQGITQKSTITIKEPKIINDLREKIKIKYIIEVDGIKLPSIEVMVLNKKYAIYNELSNFKNNDMIISQSNTNGFMTAKDMFLKYAKEEDKVKLTSNSIFKIYCDTSDSEVLYNKDKVIIYTDPTGRGLIYARTYCDTGLPTEDGHKTQSLDDNSLYISDGIKIYKGFAVKCRNINQIVISTPSENSPLKGWYPRVRYSYFDKVYERTDSSIKLIYSVPEFYTQIFGKYGRPYIDIVDEKARYIGSNTVRVKNTPMYIKIDKYGKPLTISAYKKLSDGTTRPLYIKNHNFLYGLVEFEENLSENDNIYINYTYEEQYYHYKGYYNNFDKETKMIDLNLNPIVYNTFTDTSNEMLDKKKSYELFNRTIHFFLRPMRVINGTTGEVQSDNLFTLYHKFDNQDALGPFDLHIGRIFVRHHSSLKSTVLLDTRHRGGGLIESMKEELRKELEPDSDYYLDIGTLDGKPYQENSVLVIRVDNRVLTANGGRFTENQVRTAIDKWSSYGTYNIVEFVEIIKNEDLPENNMVVNKYISNKIDYKPFFFANIKSS